LSVASQRCEAWCLALRKEHGLRMHENRDVRLCFASKEEGKITWIKEELLVLYFSIIIIKTKKPRKMKYISE
jgi:hypothetical protein